LKFELPNLGCGLSASAAYSPVFMVLHSFLYILSPTCEHDNTKTSLEVFKAKLKATLSIEILIAKRNSKLVQHFKKWDSFIPALV